MKPKNKKLKKIMELLKFIKTIDDPEIIESTIDAIIEMLEEETK